MNEVTRLTRPCKRIYKWIFSFVKSDWEFKDYPIEFLESIQKSEIQKTNVVVYPWVARIINWYWMNGVGNTREEALANLKAKFEDYKTVGSILPRPGAEVEIKFARVDRIENLEQEAVNFFRDIFDKDYYDMFISDESSLYDFFLSDEEFRIKTLKIKELYGIDIIDDDYLIVDILERIREGIGIT